MPAAHTQVQRIFGRTIISAHTRTYIHTRTQIRQAIDSYMLTRFIIVSGFYGNQHHPSLPLP